MDREVLVPGRGGTTAKHLLSAALILLGSDHCLVAAPIYTAVDLTPSGVSDSSAYGSSGTQQVGSGYGPATGGNFHFHALLWSGTPESAVDLNPIGFVFSQASGTNGTQQVGGGHGPATANNNHALLWSGTADSAVDLHPTGKAFVYSYARGASDTQQVGYGQIGPELHALLWTGTADSAVDLNPSGFNGSEAFGISGTQQVGDAYIRTAPQNLVSHAFLWRGTADSAVDLNPIGMINSTAAATNGTQQVGSGSGAATGGDFVQHALLWSGTPTSAFDLNPAGFDYSWAIAISGTLQVGGGHGPATANNDHALLWSGTATSAVDLHQFLPAGFVRSYATGIDAQGNVAGYSTYTSGGSSSYHPILWQVAPEPSALALLGIAAAILLAYAWRRGRQPRAERG